MTEGKYALGTPVDLAEYQKWRDSYIKDSGMVSTPYQELTEENIANISSMADSDKY